MQDDTVHRGDRTQPRTWGASTLALLAGGLDLAIVQLWLSGRIDTQTALLEHFAATLCLGAAAILWQRRVTPETAAMVGVMVLFGPLGGLGLLMVQIGSVSRRSGKQRPSQRIDPAVDTAQHVMSQLRQGRRPNLNGPRPPSFAQVFRSGSLAQQQHAIAAILRHYQPELLPLLKQALASPVPALRVQAAAVYAKLRGTFEARAKAVLAAADAPEDIDDVAAFATEAEAVASAGFADDETCALLRAAACRAIEAAEVPNGPNHQGKTGMRKATTSAIRVKGGPTQPPALKRYSCGGVA